MKRDRDGPAVVLRGETFMASRTISSVIQARRQLEGEGFPIRRPFPTPALPDLDPFLMLDEVGPVDYPPGQALGAPDHPHRGFETVSYLLAGEKLHEDSAGGRQLLRPGDVQWMTAGAGIVHSELPGPEFKAAGGRAHSFQIWVNLPAERKAATPGYQHLPAAEIPIAEAPAGGIAVAVIAGEAFGVAARIGTSTPVWLQDWRVAAGAAAEVPIPSHFNVAAYVFEGAVAFGPDRTVIADGSLAIFAPGDALEIAAPAGSAGGRFLLLAGEPLNEPVARYGPFVMNTQAEIAQAVEDFRAGRMGAIAR